METERLRYPPRPAKRLANDAEWDREQARYRAIQAYENLRKQCPTSDLLKFAKVTTRGWWIFKREEIEISPEHVEEYAARYSPGEKRYPLALDSYASDLEKALQK